MMLFLPIVVAGEQLGQHVVQFVQRGRLDAVQRGDAQQHVVAQALGELRQHARRPDPVQVHQ